MEIVVKGKGSLFFTPNEIRMSIRFFTKDISHENVLTKGGNEVLSFINEILLEQGFNREDLKTRNFLIREEKKYNEITKKDHFDGYSYIQDSTLKFKYNMEKFAAMMESISKLENPPYCQINFGVDNEIECKKAVLAKAYEEAFERASAIADAAGKQLKQCMKINFEPFSIGYLSSTSIGGEETFFSEKAMMKSAKVIKSFFTPEDIEVSETLYCLWIAE
jgi:uncharacterized protein YggE